MSDLPDNGPEIAAEETAAAAVPSVVDNRNDLARRYGLPLVELDEISIDRVAATSLPISVLVSAHALPYRLDNQKLYVAVADPSNVLALDELRLVSRLPLVLGIAQPDLIEEELEKLNQETAANKRRGLIDDIEFDSPDDDDGGPTVVPEDDAPMARLLNAVILEAAEAGASDIHFEPRADAMVVRLRVDGVLAETQRVPKRLSEGLTTLIKVKAKLDIAERRKPQDGRISLSSESAGRALDIRVASLPTVEGEKIVMRLIDKSRSSPTLDNLGLPPDPLNGVRDLLATPTGALLVTGPTGSGKSTTLYAGLGLVNTPERNIITVEDPVEYRIDGVNQVQVLARAGLTFASALRSILRSDPDIVMVGEVRDGETAQISIEAALTGHLVLSTLHTNDAPGAITRLTEMGVEPFLVGAAVSGVLAQRLVRRLCDQCKQPYEPNEAEIEAAGFAAVAPDGLPGPIQRAGGCSSCGKSGYKGRTGVYQFMAMDDEMERLASSSANRDVIEEAARRKGMATLWEAGLSLVINGETSLEELGRVITEG